MFTLLWMDLRVAFKVWVCTLVRADTCSLEGEGSCDEILESREQILGTGISSLSPFLPPFTLCCALYCITAAGQPFTFLCYGGNYLWSHLDTSKSNWACVMQTCANCFPQYMLKDILKLISIIFFLGWRKRKFITATAFYVLFPFSWPYESMTSIFE